MLILSYLAASLLACGILMPALVGSGSVFSLSDPEWVLWVPVSGVVALCFLVYLSTVALLGSLVFLVVLLSIFKFIWCFVRGPESRTSYWLKLHTLAWSLVFGFGALIGMPATV